MIPALVEGYLEERLIGALWRQLGRHEEPLVVRNAGGSPFWAHARRYNEAGRHRIVLGLADLEQEVCAPAAIDKLGKPLSAGFKLRLAVRMIESWIMADREAFAAQFGLRVADVPLQPDLLPHPKRTVVELARRSRKKLVRDAMIPAGVGLVGAEYTAFMARFVESRWRLRHARTRSPSLERACLRWSGA
ncbi:MAG: hypothetical protein IT503_20530 [Burkholderiaceae bacterium]|nr:MAG: hypothetical protein F9K36_16985 [Burkholderiaceae bacterium]MBE7424976.1 hypothetical protein [Ideonella sp.]MCC7288568.1 hypothetical protein [Burkholderiaceae bacterium]